MGRQNYYEASSLREVDWRSAIWGGLRGLSGVSEYPSPPNVNLSSSGRGYLSYSDSFNGLIVLSVVACMIKILCQVSLLLRSLFRLVQPDLTTFAIKTFVVLVAHNSDFRNANFDPSGALTQKTLSNLPLL